MLKWLGLAHNLGLLLIDGPSLGNSYIAAMSGLWGIDLHVPQLFTYMASIPWQCYRILRGCTRLGELLVDLYYKFC